MFNSQRGTVLMTDDDDYRWLDLEDDDFVDEPTQEIKCECGVKYSSHPNIHSEWCPLYTPPMGGQ
jgi:hypothetical protein